MKTLIFCTAYSDSATRWLDTHSQWIRAVKSSGLQYDQILIPDDGSPEIPELAGALIINDHDDLARQPTEQIIIRRFANRLGRPSLFDQPGWYRSFVWAGYYAQKFNYEKVIHIEADACVISSRFVDYLNNFKEGWEAFWCPRHRLSEAAIQIIAGSNPIEAFSLYSQIDYSNFRGQAPDPVEGIKSYFPYTTNRNFIGDRYGEYTKEIPKNADYACQVYDGISRWWVKD